MENRLHWILGLAFIIFALGLVEYTLELDTEQIVQFELDEHGGLLTDEDWKNETGGKASAKQGQFDLMGGLLDFFTFTLPDAPGIINVITSTIVVCAWAILIYLVASVVHDWIPFLPG